MGPIGFKELLVILVVVLLVFGAKKLKTNPATTKPIASTPRRRSNAASVASPVISVIAQPLNRNEYPDIRVIAA